MSDRFDLRRFHEAQAGGVYEQAEAELSAGRKTGHWMWFVFPQVRGLGRSSTAQHYAISGLEEARAYLDDPVLGPRLRRAAQTLVELPGSPSAVEVLGSIDALKLRSSMTLFGRAADSEPIFEQVLDRYFDGAGDAETDRLLAEIG